MTTFVSPSSSVPAPQFGDRGFIPATELAIRAGVQQDINSAFGGNLNPALETPQGQIASSEAAITGNAQDQFCALANGVDPAYAAGRMQDAIGRIYFIERKPSQPTVVQATCTGAQGTVIDEGSLARALDGNIYASQQQAHIPIGGSVSIPFACVTPGPIACPSGTLTTIYRIIPGWDSITNPDDGVIGNNVESRVEFETRRSESVALNALGFLAAIQGAVLGVNGVLDAYTVENDQTTTQTIGGVSLVRNSLYVAVSGGTNKDVAQAIWSRKAPGCAYNGNTSVTVQDTNSGYTPPYPSYTVQFQRPSSLPILFAINIVNGPQVPSDVVTQVQNAIIAAFAGADGGPRARIGSTIYASRYNAPVAALGSWAQIISLQIGSKNTPAASFTASIAGTVLTVTAVGSGTLAVGQNVRGIAVPDGVTIASLGSGSGGTGTYNLNTPLTIGSESMTAQLANQNFVTVNIDQAPTIAAANIAVTLT